MYNFPKLETQLFSTVYEFSPIITFQLYCYSKQYVPQKWAYTCIYTFDGSLFVLLKRPISFDQKEIIPINHAGWCRAFHFLNRISEM